MTDDVLDAASFIANAAAWQQAFVGLAPLIVAMRNELAAAGMPVESADRFTAIWLVETIRSQGEKGST